MAMDFTTTPTIDTKLPDWAEIFPILDFSIPPEPTPEPPEEPVHPDPMPEPDPAPPPAS